MSTRYPRSFSIPNVIVKYGIDLEGFVYPVLGETYSIKEELKALGASFTRGLNWFFVNEEDAQKSGRPYCQILAKNILRAIGHDVWDFIYPDEMKAMVDEFQVKSEVPAAEPSNSEFVGEVGKMYQSEITIKKVLEFDGQYGQTSMFIMEDNSGNILVWNTASKSKDDYEEGTNWVVKGQVKDHKVYRDTKQTVLTRCRLTDS